MRCICLFLCLFVFGHTVRAAGTVYDLRGLGRLTAEEGVRDGVPCTRITAADAGAAQALYSKFVSDFTTLVTVRPEPRRVGDATLTALCYAGGRRLLPVWRPGQAVVEVYACADEAQLQAFLVAAAADLRDAATPSERAYPLFLDIWDRRNMGFWYSPGFKAITKDRTDDQDFDFMRPLLLNVNTVGGGIAAIAARCDRDDLGFKTNVWFDVSNYAYDANPEAISISDPDVTLLSNYYGDVPLSDNPIRRAQTADILAYLGQFTPDDHLMTITDPHGETAARTVDAYYGGCNRDEYSRRDFVHYLRDLRQFSLADLGRRWYGDAARFATWDDVRFPREREFCGWVDGGSQDLAGTWRWRRASRDQGVAEDYFAPDFDDRTWFDYRQPGSEYLAGRNAPGGWMRHTFAADARLLAAAGPVYLTVCPFNNAPRDNPSTVYLNGRKIADLSFGHGYEWGQVDVRDLLEPTGNVLAVFTRDGNVRGPVFLTLQPAYESFPTPDAHLNARKFDLTEWIADDCARAVARSARRLRGIDPVRGIKLMAPHDNVDIMAPVMAEWGMYPHCTGQGAYFRPWLRRNGYLHGIMASSEPSQSATDVRSLKRIFFTLTMEGGNADDYFYNLHDILVSPEKEAWYVANLPYYHLLGQFDLRQPEIAIAWSLRTNRYGVKNGDSYMNDMGRGDLQQTHFSYVYGSEKDLVEGRLADYKVLIDCNFNTLDPAEVDALEAWVRAGGTFVLNQRTGRNSILQPGAWPIAKLTGCRATVRPQTGTVTFVDHPSILTACAGKTFRNLGEPIDYKGRNYFSDSIALDPQSPDVEVLAHYEDGEAAVAVRALGAGKVVILGSAFYRKSTDVKGFWIGSPEQTRFLKDLLGDLGVQSVVSSDQDTLWAERFIANNGSTELLVLGNQHDTDTLDHGAAVWDLGFAPRRVFDPVTGEDLPVRVDGSRVTISDLTIPPYELRYFAAERTEAPLAGMPGHWLRRQAQMWKAVPEGEPVAPPPPSWPVYFYGTFEVQQFADEAAARRAMDPATAPADGWRSMYPADWAAAGLPCRPGLWGVYRQRVQLAPEWLADLRGVQLIRTPGRSLWNHVREISLNGVAIDRADPETILAAVKPGENLVQVLCAADAKGNGGFYGSMGLRRLPGASGTALAVDTGWTAYPDEVSPENIDLPAAGNWMLLRREVAIPAEHRGSQVWLEVRGTPTLASVNGQVRYCSNNYGARIPSADPLYLNVTPDIRFGAPNELVLTRSIGFGAANPDRLSLTAVKLFFVPAK